MRGRTSVTARAVCLAAALLFGLFAVQPVDAQRDSIPPGYPQSLRQDLAVLLAAGVPTSSDPRRLVTLAEVYMNIGDDLLTDPDERRKAYEEGARIAHRALEVHEADPEAHFLYAANLGSAAQVKGITAAMFTVNEIKTHLRRAIDLQPDHAPSLQFMGGLLAQLPWFLGGDEVAAQDYLRRAIAADGNYTNARIILAKLLIKKISTMRQGCTCAPWLRRRRRITRIRGNASFDLKPDACWTGSAGTPRVPSRAGEVTEGGARAYTPPPGGMSSGCVEPAIWAAWWRASMRMA